ncbi:MAG: hypothetical protein R3F34_04605 [Planctomycetota bacterium]
MGWPGPDFPFRELPASSEPRREANTAEAARNDFVAPGAIGERAVEAYVRAALAADPVRVDWEGWEVFADEMEPSEVAVPVLVLRGALDPIADPEPVARFARSSAPRVVDVRVEGCDHAVLLEDPGRERCLEAIRSFLAGP